MFNIFAIALPQSLKNSKLSLLEVIRIEKNIAYFPKTSIQLDAKRGRKIQTK